MSSNQLAFGSEQAKKDTVGSFIRYHRADFLRVLVNNIPSRYKTHFNHRLERYTRSSPSKVDLYFGNGVTTTCDVLIGSDGVKSAVRQCLLTEKAKIEERLGNLEEAQRLLNCIEPKWTGIVAYRALVPTDRLKNYKDKHPDLSIRIPLPDSLPIMVRLAVISPCTQSDHVFLYFLRKYMGQHVVNSHNLVLLSGRVYRMVTDVIVTECCCLPYLLGKAHQRRGISCDRGTGRNALPGTLGFPCG